MHACYIFTLDMADIIEWHIIKDRIKGNSSGIVQEQEDDVQENERRGNSATWERLQDKRIQ